MSRKNLSKSVIEGGRHRGNKWDRYNSHAEERARLKNYLQDVIHDLENYEEYDVEPIQHVYKEFSDKLGPMYRWLQSQVGRLWNDVRSDAFKKFDIRTTPGRHIIHDHLLRSVQTGPETGYHFYSVPGDETVSYSNHDYYVDAEGILCKKHYLGRRKYRSEERNPQIDTNRLTNWLGSRIVGRMGEKLFWFVPAGKSKKYRNSRNGQFWRTQWGPPKDRKYYYSGPYGVRWEYLSQQIIYKTDSMGRVIYEVVDGIKKATSIGYKKVWETGRKPSLRQDRRLNEEELKYWKTLPVYYQTKILEESPNYTNHLKNQYY